MSLATQLIVMEVLKNHLDKTMQDPNTPQRFPATDEQSESPFVSAGENEDIVWEELDKQEQKINSYWERQNENKWEERTA
jgi:hypothetical protein